jgi:hypothetical protein
MKFLILALSLFSASIATLAAEPIKSERSLRADAHRKMRMEYAASAEYNPYASGLLEIRKASSKYLESGDFEKALGEAEKGLALDRLNIDLLMTAAAAARNKGNTTMADELRQRWMALIDSIVDRSLGDGRSYAKAFKVISVDEEYATLSVFKLECTKQIVVENSGSEYDILTVKGKDSDGEFELYFNVDIPKKWLARHLFGKEEQNPPTESAEEKHPPASQAQAPAVPHS